MNKETGKPVRDGLSSVTSEKKFTAEKKDGTIGMQFTFDAEKLQGDDVVVFEDLIHNGITVTSHADLSDKDQTVHFPKKPEKPGTPEPQQQESHTREDDSISFRKIRMI